MTSQIVLRSVARPSSRLPAILFFAGKRMRWRKSSFSGRRTLNASSVTSRLSTPRARSGMARKHHRNECWLGGGTSRRSLHFARVERGQPAAWCRPSLAETAPSREDSTTTTIFRSHPRDLTAMWRSNELNQKDQGTWRKSNNPQRAWRPPAGRGIGCAGVELFYGRLRREMGTYSPFMTASAPSVCGFTTKSLLFVDLFL